jgi:hypothetical protein
MKFLALPTGWIVNLETILYARPAWVENREVIAVRFAHQHSDTVLAAKEDSDMLVRVLKSVPTESHQVNPLSDAVGCGAQSLVVKDQALTSAEKKDEEK